MRLPISYVRRAPPWLLAPFLLLALVIYLVMIMRAEARRSEDAERARQMYLESCQRRQSECERSLELHHEACFRATYRRGSRWSGSTFEREDYIRCVTMGSEGFYRERDRDRQQRRDEAKELGLPEGTRL